MAKAKNPVIPIEELTVEERVDKALQYEKMADDMIMYQWKNTYYNKSMKMWKSLFDEATVPEAKKNHRAVRVKRSKAVAEGCIADYKEACRLRDEAKNEDQTRIAIQHFETLADYEEKHPARTFLLEKELVDEYEKCLDAREQANLEREKMNRKRSRRVTRNLAIVGVIAVMILGGMLFRKTAYYQYYVGQVQSMMGDNTRAWARYKSAWTMSGREDWKQLYLETRYQDGVDCFEKGDYSTAYSDFKKLADDEQYLDSEAYFVKCELAKIAKAETGDTVKYANNEWYLMDRDGSNVLLMKKASCADLSFETAGGWSSSEGRSWLNSEFLDQYFRPDEIEAICETRLDPVVNADYHTADEETVTDKVFLLTVEEFEKYRSILKDTQKLWWLRTPGAGEGTLCVVNAERKVLSYGYTTTEGSIHLRPAIWVDTNIEG